MKIVRTFNYSGRYAAELENGQYLLAENSMELLLCEKVPEGYKVIKSGIIGGIMMRTAEDFKWCVEHLQKKNLS